MDFVIFGIYCLVLSGIFGLVFSLIVAYFKDLRLERRIRDVEGDIEHLADSVNGKAGQVAKQEKQERLQNSVVKMGLTIKKAADEKMPTEQIVKEVLPGAVGTLLVENPELAIKAAKAGLNF